MQVFAILICKNMAWQHSLRLLLRCQWHCLRYVQAMALRREPAAASRWQLAAAKILFKLFAGIKFCWVFKKLGDPTVCARGREVKAGRGGAGRSGMWWGPWARAGAAPQRVGGSGPAGWVGRWGPWGVGMGPRFQNLSSCPCVSKDTDMHKAYLSL